IFGEPLAINAGTAGYFMGERLLRRALVGEADRLRLYDLYFESMRAGHAGQAIDIEGLARFVAPLVKHGETFELERRVLAIHRLETAAPAAALARMGAVAGGGSQGQVDAVGGDFGAVGRA